MNPEDARKHMDENTIGLVVMFGSTYNGQFEDVVLADKIVGGSVFPAQHRCHGSVYVTSEHSSWTEHLQVLRKYQHSPSTGACRVLRQC